MGTVQGRKSAVRSTSVAAWFAGVLAVAVGLLGGRSSAQAHTAGACRLLVKDGDSFAWQELPGLDPANRSLPLSPPSADAHAQAVVCTRDSVVPEPTDYRVLLDMKLPLSLHVSGREPLWLELRNGQLIVRAPNLSPEEAQATQDRVNEMQRYFLRPRADEER
jgi:hypothetical protein